MCELVLKIVVILIIIAAGVSVVLLELAAVVYSVNSEAASVLPVATY